MAIWNIFSRKRKPSPEMPPKEPINKIRNLWASINKRETDKFVQLVQQLQETGIDLATFHFSDGTTPIFFAMKCRAYPIFQYLVDNRLGINLPTTTLPSSNDTILPIHFALTLCK